VKSEQTCRINVWIVDDAAEKFNQAKDDAANSGKSQQMDGIDESSPVDELMDTLKGLATLAPSWCVRVVDGRLQRQYIGPDCPPRKYDSSSNSNSKAGAILEWLASPLAGNQITEHASDAWRLVALLEVGGLYLDLDVIILSDLLLRLPRNAVPVQPRVGAYRMNGGVLRLGDRKDDDENHERNVDKKRRVRGGRKDGKTFIEAMVEDHLYWAPRLATLPKEHNGQTFGFLGPCALTRVFVSKQFNDQVLVLPEASVEPRINRELCSNYRTRGSLAVHFGGKTKENWRSMVIREKCLEEIFRNNVCPNTYPK